MRTKVGLTLRGKFVLFFIFLLIFLIIIISLLLTLPQFYLTEVNVNNLTKIEEQEILNKANLVLGKNIFLQSYFKAEKEINTIKTVKNVNIRLDLPNIVNIHIEEREEVYQIKEADKYYIIDAQGYLLKIIENKINVPEIIGLNASFEDDIRLEIAELIKLENINKIYNTAKVLNIDGLISEITLNTLGFNINFGSNKKKAHFENTNNLMNSMQFVREILCSEEEKNKSGDIYATEEGARFRSK